MKARAQHRRVSPALPSVSDRTLAELLVARLHGARGVQLFLRELAPDLHYASAIGCAPTGAMVEAEAIAPSPVDALVLAFSNLDEAVAPEPT